MSTDKIRARLDELQTTRPKLARELTDDALRAVLEIHWRIPAEVHPDINPDECSECGEPYEGWFRHTWPCPTIAAIAEKLGVGP